MNKFEEALKWIDRKKREHFGEIALLKGFAFDGQKYKTPEEMETIEYALKLTARLEQVPSKRMILAATSRNDKHEQTMYHGIFKAMIEQLKKEVEDA